MRQLIRVATAAMVGLILAAPMAAPAAAFPAPNQEEWWFDTFGIESDVWPLTRGDGITVALIDTGVNASLPELAGVVLPGTDVVGGGGDGRTDSDTHQGHGTAMAALIAAQGGGSAGWLGIAPGVKILPIRNGGQMTPEIEAAAIRYAADHGAKVINISQADAAGLSDPNHCPAEVQDAVIDAVQRDAVILAAAGNAGDQHNDPLYPAACPGVVAVGAYDHLGNAWHSTQRQDYVAISAPGSGVGSIGGDGRLYHYGAGTSQAAALASGAVALMRSRFPNESARRIVQRVIATVTDFGPPGKDDQTGYGSISLRKGLTATVPADAPNPVFDRLDQVLAARRVQSTPSATPVASGEKTSSKVLRDLLIVGAIFIVVCAVYPLARIRPRPPADRPPTSPGPDDRSPQHGPPPPSGPTRDQGPPPERRW